MTLATDAILLAVHVHPRTEDEELSVHPLDVSPSGGAKRLRGAELERAGRALLRTRLRRFRHTARGSHRPLGRPLLARLRITVRGSRRGSQRGSQHKVKHARMSPDVPSRTAHSTRNTLLKWNFSGDYAISRPTAR